MQRDEGNRFLGLGTHGEFLLVAANGPAAATIAPNLVWPDLIGQARP